MLTIWDYIERAKHGPEQKEGDFDRAMGTALRDLSAKYKRRIRFDPCEVIPDDDSADAIFEAAVELLALVGMYHVDTGKVIQFDRREILEIAATRPHQLFVGTGKDRFLIRQRTPESDFPVMNVAGPVGGPVDEDIFRLCMQSFAQEWTVDGLLSGTLRPRRELDTEVGRPGEMARATQELVLLQEACQAAGRPGLYVGCIPVGAVSAEAVIGAVTCSGLATARGQLPLQPIPEGKLCWRHFNIALFSQSYGMSVWNSGVTIINTVARSPIEAAMARLAALLGTIGLTNGDSCCVWCADEQGVTNARRNLWVNCVITRALDRHVGLPAYLLGFSFAGPCTEMSFQEIAAYTTAYTCGGAEMIWGGGTSNAMFPNMYAGLSARMVGEMSRAVCGLRRKDANDIVNILYAKFEDQLSFAAAPKGKSFAQCYNLNTLQPTPEFENLFQQSKQNIADECGIKFPY